MAIPYRRHLRHPLDGRAVRLRGRRDMCELSEKKGLATTPLHYPYQSSLKRPPTLYHYHSTTRTSTKLPARLTGAAARTSGSEGPPERTCATGVVGQPCLRPRRTLARTKRAVFTHTCTAGVFLRVCLEAEGHGSLPTATGVGRIVVCVCLGRGGLWSAGPRGWGLAVAARVFKI